MNTVILTPSKPPVVPAPLTGEQYVDRYNKRFMNPVVSLSDAEATEAESLKNSLIKRSIAKYGQDYGGDMRMLYVYPLDCNDLDALRIYDKLFDYGDPYDVRSFILLVRKYGCPSVANVSTESFTSYSRVKEALKQHMESREAPEFSLREMDSRRHAILGISLLNPDLAPLIPSIIVDRSITEPGEVVAVLEEMKNSLSSLSGGVL